MCLCLYFQMLKVSNTLQLFEIKRFGEMLKPPMQSTHSLVPNPFKEYGKLNRNSSLLFSLVVIYPQTK